MAHAQWAVDVRSIDKNQKLFSLNADKLMMPASNMKILTLATAAEVLGWDARMTTTLEASGPVEDGVLRGDLFVRGGGDPTINTREDVGAAVFSSWIAALREAGIKAIEGRIIGDDQAFDDENLGGGWAWDYLQYRLCRSSRSTAIQRGRCRARRDASRRGRTGKRSACRR